MTPRERVYGIVCKRCGKSKGRHSSVKMRCPVPPPYPESVLLYGIVDRFSEVDRWSEDKPKHTSPLPGEGG